MKKLIYLLWFAIAGVACSTMGKSEKAILEYMRDQTGSPKLEIEFTEVQIVKQTVGDSINILQEKYEQDMKDKSEKIEKVENSIKGLEESLKSVPKSDRMTYHFYSQMLESSKKQLKELNDRTIVNEKVRYDGEDKAKVIATVVNCRMTSLVNPVLKAKQTREGSFLLSVDESVCIRQLK